jgi:hypothetical protein
MIPPTDYFAAIVAKLRQISANPTCSAMLLHSDLCDLADAIERLDAEMRNELLMFSMVGNTEGIRALHSELAELRARLTACEKDAERYRFLRECNLRSAKAITLGALFQGDAALDAAIDAARASVPKDAATGDEGKGGVG